MLSLQIFRIGLDKLRQFRGKITLWGEIEKQGILPNGTEQEVQKAVKSV